jgi:hypothetical protein
MSDLDAASRERDDIEWMIDQVEFDVHGLAEKAMSDFDHASADAKPALDRFVTQYNKHFGDADDG